MERVFMYKKGRAIKEKGKRRPLCVCVCVCVCISETGSKDFGREKSQSLR